MCRGKFLRSVKQPLCFWKYKIKRLMILRNRRKLSIRDVGVMFQSCPIKSASPRNDLFKDKGSPIFDYTSISYGVIESPRLLISKLNQHKNIPLLSVYVYKILWSSAPNLFLFFSFLKEILRKICTLIFSICILKRQTIQFYAKTYYINIQI